MKKILLALIYLEVLQNGNSIKKIKTQLLEIMSKQETFDALIQRLNAATNEIAADLQKLRDEIAALPKDTVSDESLATLDANITTLETMGADPVDPVPVEPPVDPNA